MTKIVIVIPAYNEEKQIGNVVSNLHINGYNSVIVVDDASKDKTIQEAQNAGATVLQHLINRGQGAALKTGIDFALQKGADIIVTFDADGQHQVTDLSSLIEPVAQGKVDVTLGSRFLDNRSNVPFLKKIFLKCGVLFTRLFSGIKLTDTHNGLRAFSREAAGKIKITQDRMEHASEILDQIHKKNISFKEVPVKIMYTKYSKQKGQSVLNAFNIAMKIILRKLVK